MFCVMTSFYQRRRTLSVFYLRNLLYVISNPAAGGVGQDILIPEFKLIYYKKKDFEHMCTMLIGTLFVCMVIIIISEDAREATLKVWNPPNNAVQYFQM
jgi:hypothetical protein